MTQQPDEGLAPPEFYRALGRTIMVLRTDQGLSRRQLAQRAMISYSYLSAIENGTKPPSPKIILLLAERLGVRLHELIAAAEARLDAAEPAEDFIDASAAAELDRHEQKTLAREHPDLFDPKTLAPRPIPRTDLGALTELRGLLARMDPDDIERVLDLARRLASDQ